MKDTISKEVRNMSEKEMIFNLMKDLCIPANILGYHYIKSGIRLGLEHPETLNAMVKEFYPTIAEMHNTTGSRVERAMRHAISKSFECAKYDFINKIFGSYSYKRGIPTVSEYICTIVEYLKMNS